ncbi:hypothetical protein HMPREF9244_00720 [Alloscardovia omnicolens F0580]|uniref:Uncharacterized protein n=1 Tax=Alloscardovia omnicolens F0580 TaxID=1321816 RepID=U1SK54_9BIFI|nr:hypothetical protein HMPREF9244_00720 [Alloscardovia omnicolens F0580]
MALSLCSIFIAALFCAQILDEFLANFSLSFSSYCKISTATQFT